MKRLLPAAVVAAALAACTPQQALVASLMPTSAASTLVGNTQRVSSENRRRIAELDTAGRWDELARFADENIKKDSFTTEWWIVKGYALTQAGDHRGAIAAYSEAVRMEPDSGMAWNNLAQAYRSSGDPQRAVVVLERAMLAVRDSPSTPYLLGESYSDIRRYDDAAAAYRQAVSMDPKLALAWFGLARAYTRLGKDRDALEARRTLEKLDPKLALKLDER
ncbi:MAG TPA: tetratricopeptide repeat protein [Burkholderiales bacterium]|nr:tetratricopeptide repeat protein [Burkholderiales bacterium]